MAPPNKGEPAAVNPPASAGAPNGALPNGTTPDSKPSAPEELPNVPPKKLDVPRGMAPPKAGEGTAVSVPVTPLSVGPDDPFRPERVGWTPHFKFPDKGPHDVQESLLDSDTALDGVLADKFYGDWYQNTGVIIFACLASWLVALLGGGLAWVILVMATCGTYYRTSIRRVRRNYRDDINREMSKQKLEDENETLEWINSFLDKFWPIVAPVISDTVISTVDQVLSSATPPFLDSLKLSTFTLGTKPPRVDYVKTYRSTEPDVALMDWKFSFTPMDTADMTANEAKNKVNPKVVLDVRVGKGVVSKALPIIVEDFQFAGLIRIKFKFQLPFPHIDRVDVCFLERPEIDYVCKPIGGDTLGFDINFIPGLESFILDMIHGNVGPMMYAPNVFPIEVAKMLSAKSDTAIGIVAITLHGAHQLKNSDAIGAVAGGTNDPYTIVSINGRDSVGQTSIQHDTDNPRWNETIYAIITSYTDTLTLDVYDFNDFRKDKHLGTANFALDQLENEHDHENLTLEVMGGGRQRGALSCDVHFFPVLEARKLDDGETEPPPELNTGIMRLTMEQAKDLDGTKSLVGQLNPYAVLSLNGKEIHKTGQLKRTNNPIFPNSTKETIISDRRGSRIDVVIKDGRDFGADPVLGSFKMKLNDLYSYMAREQNWFNLHGAKTGRVKLNADWKPVAVQGDLGSGGYVPPVGVMRVHLQRAQDILNVEAMGKSDPYARILLSGIQVARTVTFQNNLDPDWDEVFYIPVHSPREKITMELMDEEDLGKDRSLGHTEIALTDYMHERTEGEFDTHDAKTPQAASLHVGGRSKFKGTLHYTVAFYPILPVRDPEEEEEEKEKKEEEEEEKKAQAAEAPSNSGHKPSSSSASKELTNNDSRDVAQAKANGKEPAKKEESTNGSANGEVKLNGEEKPTEEAKPPPKPKIQLTPQNVSEYNSGLLVFKIHNVNLANADARIEVLMDDHVFPSYGSGRVRSKVSELNDFGDAFVRELDASKITLRIVEREDIKGAGEEAKIKAKLTGPTLQTLQRCLYNPTELHLRSNEGVISKVTVSAKYLPVNMTLDPEESINNMGTLRVDVLDAADLPSADRNGYSDPFCKFRVNDKTVHKTKVQKKTLHPAWNEFFETQIKNRIRVNFMVDVFDWDFGDKADVLGAAQIDLSNLTPFKSEERVVKLDGKSGQVRVRFLFKPDYVMRTRQGTSTFEGTFAVPGKIVGAPVKGVGFVGGGVVKGASFLKHGIKGRVRSGSKSEANGSAAAIADGDAGESRASLTVPNDARSPPQTPTHGRSPSMASSKLGSPGAASEKGTAVFSIISASDYPSSAHVRVIVKQLTPKPKELHKTKALKSDPKAEKENGAGPTVVFDRDHETFKVANVSPDAQFQIQVKSHATFGSDHTLGEAPLFVDDQGSSAGRERTVKAGDGSIVLTTTFVPATGPAQESDSASIRPGTASSVDMSRDSPDSRRVSRRWRSKRGSTPNGDSPPS